MHLQYVALVLALVLAALRFAYMVRALLWLDKTPTGRFVSVLFCGLNAFVAWGLGATLGWHL